MKSFEYAHPETEAEALEFLNEFPDKTMILAGGTDSVTLLKRELLTPERVVDIKNITSLQGIETDSSGLLIGAGTTLEAMLEDPQLAPYSSVSQVIQRIHSIQIQSMGTLGGDLCHLPNCWYYRNGYGLLSNEGRRSLPEEGENRYHAILGNSGPAKFVSASRFAPPLIAMGAQVRVIGPKPEQEQWMPLERFYQTPKTNKQQVTVLKPGQLLTHIRLPHLNSIEQASYEVLPSQGLDWPTAAAAVAVEYSGDRVQSARIVLGHVAPTPWVSSIASQAILGKPMTIETACEAAEVALAEATPLSDNRYKVSQTKAAIKRALMLTARTTEGVV